MAPVIYTTGRLTVQYATTRFTHECSFFQRDGATQGQVVSQVRVFLAAIAPIVLASTVWTTARWQEAGTNFSLPVEWDPLTGSAPGTIPRDLEPLFISFRARSVAGKQVGIQVFAVALPLTDNYRYTPGEDPNVDAALTAWNTLGNSTGDEDGNQRVIYNYANMGVHAYWQRQLRKP